jgi:hypothetical protein
MNIVWRAALSLPQPRSGNGIIIREISAHTGSLNSSHNEVLQRKKSRRVSFESYDSSEHFVGFFIILRNASGVVLRKGK